MITQYWSIIKAAIVALLCVISGFSVYKFQEYKYERQLSDIALVAAQVKEQAAKEYIAQEDKNRVTETKLNLNVVEKSKLLADLRTVNAKLISNGMRFKASSCQGTTNTTSITTNNVAKTSSSASITSCTLPEATARIIADTAVDADTLKLYSDTAYEYIQAVEAWRKEQNKGIE